MMAAKAWELLLPSAETVTTQPVRAILLTTSWWLAWFSPAREGEDIASFSQHVRSVAFSHFGQAAGQEPLQASLPYRGRVQNGNGRRISDRHHDKFLRHRTL